MRTERLSIFILITLLSFAVIAQNDFRDGYIITALNDTLRGALEYRTDKQNYVSCRFRSGLDIQLYTPEDITGYGYINDKYYSSLIIKGSFVEVLVSGRLSLYKLESNFYLQKTGDTLFKLEQQEKITTLRGGRLISVEDTKWKGIINFLIYDCINTTNASKDLRFNEESITKFIIKYNICTGTEYIDYKAKKPWSKIEPGILFGLMKSTISVTYTFMRLAHLAKRYQSIDPFLGILVNLSAPRLSENLSLQPELHFINQIFSADYSLHSSTGLEYHETFFYLKSLSLKFSFKYIFNKGSFAPFLQVGGSYDYNLNSTVEDIVERVVSNTVYTDISHPIVLDRFHLGYWGGLGVSKKINKLQLSGVLRYNQTLLFSTDQEFSANNTNLTLGLIVSFK